jgi:ABC-type tungstate transport system substrate-binding protein
MSIFGMFGIGQTEIILLFICFAAVVMPVVIVGVVLFVLASNRNRDDRRE